ncbi:hypothetical protein [Phyllobacterium ifriqiyense]|uniref:hypothetical protein n=1 Tax=Phyllobacterium ifriqiyense TaxID=314238 RepID=UPI00339836BC
MRIDQSNTVEQIVGVDERVVARTRAYPSKERQVRCVLIITLHVPVSLHYLETNW